MEHIDPQFDSVDPDLRDLFRRTAPMVSSTDLATLFERAETIRGQTYRQIQWRKRMTLRVTLGALAASAAVGLFALIAPRTTSAGFDLAEVERQVATTRTVTMKVTDLVDGQVRESAKLLVSGSNLVRLEFKDGWSVTDLKGAKALLVHVKDKRATLMEGVAFQDPKELNFYELFRNMAKSPSKTLPEREVEGVRAAGFVVKINDREGTVWVDVKTKLPVRVEAGEKDGKVVVTQVMNEFVFDRPLDASLFKLTPPEGFALETHGTASLAPSPDDKALAAPTVVPLVGLGPAKFGMTKDDVIKVLGKPDREFVQNKVVFLSYYSRGFELWFLPADHPRKGLSHVVCMGQHGFAIKLREFQGKTDKGIGLGATREEIIKIYGPPDHENISRMKDVFGKRATNPEELTGQSELIYNKLFAHFVLYKDKTYQIWIDAPRQAAAVPKK